MAIFALREPKGHVSAAQTHSASSVSKQSSPTSRHASPTRHPTSSSHSSGSSHSPSVKSVPLVVLNNTTISGLAQQAAQRFEQGGWTVTRYDNYQNDILSTCAYYDPSVPGAKTAADALQAQYPTIKRVKPKFPGLPSGPVVVVLTPDYQS